MSATPFHFLPVPQGGGNPRLPPPPVADTLDYVAENRVVFVADFAIITRDGKNVSNERQYSHSVSQPGQRQSAKSVGGHHVLRISILAAGARTRANSVTGG